MLEWNNEESQTTLEREYLLPGETTLKAIERIAYSAAKYAGDSSLAKKIIDYTKRGWLVFPSPIWSNMGTDRGLNISCYGSYCPDSMNGIMDTLSEIVIMTKYGGGTSAYFGALRPQGASIRKNGVSNGPMAFMQMYDSAMRVTSQGSVRRGSMAAYMDIDHPDIEEFLKIRSIGNPIQNLSYAVNVTDEFMQAMIDGDVDKRRIWSRILHSRKEKGYPYINFIDTVNRMKPDCYANHRIVNSNLCMEIFLPTSIDESFVCCITALNGLHYDDWKDTDLVEVGIRFLDAVLDEFIDKAKNIKHLERAVRFAIRHRAVGLGFTGWHSYLQSHRIPFDSFQAATKNHVIFKNIQKQAVAASKRLAAEKGEPEVCRGTGMRNATVMAVAPNTTSSSIMGQCSPGIEPFNSNYFTAWVAKGSFTRKNIYLMEDLEQMGLNTPEIWDKILKAGGSIQNIPELSEIRDVYKTFGEINQYELISQAAERQKFIDQGQSLNIHIPPNTELRSINNLHIFAWKQGVKGLYYQRSQSPSSNFSMSEECSSCAG